MASITTAGSLGTVSLLMDTADLSDWPMVRSFPCLISQAHCPPIISALATAEKLSATTRRTHLHGPCTDLRARLHITLALSLRCLVLMVPESSSGTSSAATIQAERTDLLTGAKSLSLTTWCRASRPA